MYLISILQAAVIHSDDQGEAHDAGLEDESPVNEEDNPPASKVSDSIYSAFPQS